MTTKKYSKGSGFYLETKKEFFVSNQKLLDRALERNRLYVQQPRRDLCKLCQAPLDGAVDLSSHGVDYTFCPSCGHLNGVHEDTQAYIEKLYMSDAGADYSREYLDPDYLRRANDIYVPKAEFLAENLPPGKHAVFDVGCGSGYFVYACLAKGIEASGIDVNETMIGFGNTQIAALLGRSPLERKDESSFFDCVVQSGAAVVSAVGVIEHLRQPHLLFDAFRRSRASYLYYSVPMFSSSVLLENAFPGVYPRHLSGAHTHLFTEKSLGTLNALCRAEPVAEWRFGADVMDLYRSLAAVLTGNGASPRLMANFDAGFAPRIDELQAVLDRGHFCSEIHCLVKKTG